MDGLQYSLHRWWENRSAVGQFFLGYPIGLISGTLAIVVLFPLIIGWGVWGLLTLPRGITGGLLDTTIKQ